MLTNIASGSSDETKVVVDSGITSIIDNSVAVNCYYLISQ